MQDTSAAQCLQLPPYGPDASLSGPAVCWLVQAWKATTVPTRGIVQVLPIPPRLLLP